MSNHRLCASCQQHEEPDEAYTTHVFTLSGTILEPDGSLYHWSVVPGFPPECEEIPPVPDYFASFTEVLENGVVVEEEGEAGVQYEGSGEVEVELPPLPPSPILDGSAERESDPGPRDDGKAGTDPEKKEEMKDERAGEDGTEDKKKGEMKEETK